MAGAILNVAKSIGPALALKGLQKINPKFKNFFAEAATYGYSADQALEYLSERFSPKSGFQNQLEEGERAGNLRPDKAAALQQIQAQQLPGRVMRGAAAFGGSGLAGILGGSGNQGMQDQSQQPDQQQPEAAPEQQYDPGAAFAKFPDLMKFVSQEASSGGNAQSIASKARKSVKLRTFVNTIEQEIGEPFENLLARLIGGGQQQAAQPASQGKEEFLAGLNQMGQMIQGLKGKR